MIAEVAQAAAETAKTSGGATATAIGLGILVVSNIGIWLDKIISGRLQVAKERRQAEEAQAREAEAKAKVAAQAKPDGNGNGNGKSALDLHREYVLPHSRELQHLDDEVKTINARFDKFEEHNREDHGKIFESLDDIKGLVVGKSAGAA